MKFPRVGPPGPSPSSSSSALPVALLMILLWCTTITTAMNVNTNTIRPTRTVINKRSEPIFVEDQCASFKSDLGDNLKKLLRLSWMESSKDIELCLCNSTIANFVSSGGNKQIEMAKAQVGSDKVSQALQTLITRHTPQGCGPLPSNAKRVCNSDGLNNDLCDFSCQSPFRKSNNQCLLSPSASASARSRKRSLEEEVVLMHHSTCLPHEQVCARNGHGFTHPRSSSARSSSLKGLGSGSSSQFECIDITKDLFNCGGCASGYLGFEGEILGKDCSDLPGVDDVQCLAGRCRVSRCGWGWKINGKRDGCTRLGK